MTYASTIAAPWARWNRPTIQPFSNYPKHVVTSGTETHLATIGV
jgi:hypothetical protein